MRVLLSEDSAVGTSNALLVLNSMELVVDIVVTSEELEEMTKSDEFDLIIFTSNIKDCSVAKMIEQYRTDGGIKPVMALINSPSINTLVSTLEYGADDCLLIPFNIEEFKARIKSLLRRYSSTKARDVIIGPLKWNTFSNVFFLDEKLLDISPKEKLILEVFVKNPNIIITKEKIANKVYSFDKYVNLKTISAHIHGLRKKIIHKYIAIETVKNHGYRLVLERSQ